MAACLLAVGVALFFVNKAFGVTIILIALIEFLIFKSGYKVEGDKLLLKKKSLELSKHCRSSVLDFLEGKTQDPKFLYGNDGGTIMLEIWYNEKGQVAYARLLDYVDFSFQKATDILKLSEVNASKIIAKL